MYSSTKEKPFVLYVFPLSKPTVGEPETMTGVLQSKTNVELAKVRVLAVDPVRARSGVCSHTALRLTHSYPLWACTGMRARLYTVCL